MKYNMTEIKIVTNKIMHISICLYSWKDQLKIFLIIIPENENDVI